jgi:hypothetical protein
VNIFVICLVKCNGVWLIGRRWRQCVPPKRRCLPTSPYYRTTIIPILISYSIDFFALYISSLRFFTGFFQYRDFSPVPCTHTFLPPLIWFWAFIHLTYFVSVAQQWTRRPVLMKSNRRAISVPPKTTQCLLYVCRWRRSQPSAASQAFHCVNPPHPFHGQLSRRNVTSNLIISFREIWFLIPRPLRAENKGSDSRDRMFTFKCNSFLLILFLSVRIKQPNIRTAFRVAIPSSHFLLTQLLWFSTHSVCMVREVNNSKPCFLIHHF